MGLAYSPQFENVDFDLVTPLPNPFAKAGKTTMRDNTSEQSRQAEIVQELELKEPILGFRSVQLPGMTTASTCLIMHKDDFESIKALAHPGAFGEEGKDYKMVKETNATPWMATWKFPGDLFDIKSFDLPQGASDLRMPVGEYEVQDEFHSLEFVEDDLLEKTTKSIKSNGIWSNMENLFGRTKATKWKRQMGDNQVVHELVMSDSQKDSDYPNRIPALSTSYILKDFNKPTEDELEKVKETIMALKEIGIYAFWNNIEHHCLVFYKDNERLTPMRFAELLKDQNKRKEIVDALHICVKPGATKAYIMEKWADDYIEAFAQNANYDM